MACILAATPSFGADRVTRGEINATFNAGMNGGMAILNQDGSVQAFEHAAVTEGFDGVIHLWDQGEEYCAEDWHLLGMGLALCCYYDLVGGVLNAAEVRITMDGVELSLDRTAVKRDSTFQGLTPGPEFGFTQGKIFSPSELSLGRHDLEWQVYLNGSPIPGFGGSGFFYIDDGAVCD